MATLIEKVHRAGNAIARSLPDLCKTYPVYAWGEMDRENHGVPWIALHVFGVPPDQVQALRESVTMCAIAAEDDDPSLPSIYVFIHRESLVDATGIPALAVRLDSPS